MKGQSWSIDFAIGMVLFLAVLGVMTSTIGDVFQNREFDNLLRDATRISEALMSTGYPVSWTETDVIRIGLLSNDRLSWRKLSLLEAMSENDVRNALPSAHNFAFTLSNDTEIIGFADSCSFGNELLPRSTTDQQTYFSTAYYSRSGGPTQLRVFMQSQLNTTLYEDDELTQLLNNAPQYGLIVFEDPHFNNTLNTTLTPSLLREEFRQAAEYGSTMILTGVLGTPVLGVNTTNATDNGTVQTHTEQHFLFNDTDEVNFTTQNELQFMPKEGGLLGNLDGATHQQTLVEGGSRLAALWQYEDAPAYYFADTQGSYAGDNLETVIRAGIMRASLRSEYNCTVQPELIDTPDLVKIERLIADRGRIYTLTLYAWRNP